MLGGLAITLSMGHCQIASPGQAGSPLSRRSTAKWGLPLTLQPEFSEFRASQGLHKLYLDQTCWFLRKPHSG